MRVDVGRYEPSQSSLGDQGIPLLLDTALRIDNVGWYIGFAEHQPTLVQVFQVPVEHLVVCPIISQYEHVPPCASEETTWGTWPADELSLQIDEKTFNKLRPLGAFDVWIAESQPPTSRLGQTDLQNQLSWFNVPWPERRLSSFFLSPHLWLHDLTQR